MKGSPHLRLIRRHGTTLLELFVSEPGAKGVNGAPIERIQKAM